MIFGVAYTMFDVLGYLGALWTFPVLFTVQYQCFPLDLFTATTPSLFICSVFTFMFSPRFPFHSFSPSFSTSLNHCLPLFLSHPSLFLSHSWFSSFLHLHFVLLCLFTYICLSFSSPSFWRDWVSSLNSTLVMSVAVCLTSSVRFTGHAFVSASKEHTHTHVCRHAPMHLHKIFKIL